MSVLYENILQVTWQSVVMWVIGGILIFSSGLSILEIKKINTINLLPALIVPPVVFVIKSLIGL